MGVEAALQVYWHLLPWLAVTIGIVVVGYVVWLLSIALGYDDALKGKVRSLLAKLGLSQ